MYITLAPWRTYGVLTVVLMGCGLVTVTDGGLARTQNLRTDYGGAGRERHLRRVHRTIHRPRVPGLSALSCNLDPPLHISGVW